MKYLEKNLRKQEKLKKTTKKRRTAKTNEIIEAL